jgi:heptosyltransferase-1
MISKTVKNILIIRSSAMGDIVMASPLIKGLKSAYPEARLLWLVEPQFAGLLRDNPQLDGLVMFEKGKWNTLFKQGKILALLREILALRRAMRSESIDLVLDVQGLLRSRFLAWLSGAKTRIGLVSKEPGHFFMTRMVEKGGDGRLMGSEYCHLLEVLGIDSGGCRPELFVSDDDERAALEKLKDSGAGPRYAAFAPFTTRPQKHWQDGRWGELASVVGGRLGIKAVILGGPADRERADAIASASPGDMVNMAGQLSLVQSAAVIKNAALMIGVDTGLTHMGTAFMRPTVALFGSTRPYLITASPATRVLYHPFPCSPCRRSPTCSGEFPCMADITVAEVMENSVQLLESAGGAP